MNYSKKKSEEDLSLDAAFKILENFNDNGKYNDILKMLSSKREKKSIKSKGMAKRPLTDEEFSKIIHLLNNGFSYNKDGKQKRVRPNRKVALALVIEATTGLRISDIVKLKVKHFQTTKLELHEEKTNKLQYREINANLMALVNRYAVENKLGMNDCIINCNKRNINKYLEIVTDYLGLENIGTHSFRKYYAVYVYNETKDIRILQNLLNHSSIATTQRYLGVDYKKIDKISSSVDFTNVLNLQ